MKDTESQGLALDPERLMPQRSIDLIATSNRPVALMGLAVRHRQGGTRPAFDLPVQAGTPDVNA